MPEGVFWSGRNVLLSRALRYRLFGESRCLRPSQSDSAEDGQVEPCSTRNLLRLKMAWKEGNVLALSVWAEVDQSKVDNSATAKCMNPKRWVTANRRLLAMSGATWTKTLDAKAIHSTAETVGNNRFVSSQSETVSISSRCATLKMKGVAT
jgi:hypothetical protein